MSFISLPKVKTLGYNAIPHPPSLLQRSVCPVLQQKSTRSQLVSSTAVLRYSGTRKRDIGTARVDYLAASHPQYER